MFHKIKISTLRIVPKEGVKQTGFKRSRVNQKTSLVLENRLGCHNEKGSKSSIRAFGQVSS